MRAFIRLILILLMVVMMGACYPSSDLPQSDSSSATAAITPALPALKQASPQPPTATAAISDPAFSYLYPGKPVTVTPYNPYPLGITEEPWVPTDPRDIFLATRAAELMVPRLEGEMLAEASQLFEGTRQATVWQKLNEELDPALSWEPILELQPGETHEFSVGFRTTTFLDLDHFPLLDIQTSWSISPTVGATIDPQTGFFAVDENTPHGTVYTVTADVENGRATPSIDVYVYTLEENPLVGRWHEEKQVTCSDEEEIAPSQPMDELRFLADGTFTVVWFVFEDLHSDYWGTFDYDLATGELILNVEDSTYMPDDFDGRGYVVLDGDNWLKLKDIWLGKSQSGMGSTNCGHIFTRN
jgi:hypothetical protein